jgi:hypothetical protein
MAVDFQVKITGIATSTVNTMSGVIKRVDFVLRGTKENHVYELPESTDLSDPVPESFKNLSTVTEADVVSWVNSNYTNMQAIKDHVEFMLNSQISKGQLEPTPLPWATE